MPRFYKYCIIVIKKEILIKKELLVGKYTLFANNEKDAYNRLFKQYPFYKKNKFKIYCEKY